MERIVCIGRNCAKRPVQQQLCSSSGAGSSVAAARSMFTGSAGDTRSQLTPGTSVPSSAHTSLPCSRAQFDLATLPHDRHVLPVRDQNFDARGSSLCRQR